MEVRDTKFKKFIAAEGMALKWNEERWNFLHKRYEVSETYSPYEALIDVNGVIGEVTEVPITEYEEWAKDKVYGLHPLYERR